MATRAPARLSSSPDELARLVRALDASVNVALLRELCRRRRRGEGWAYLSELAQAQGGAAGAFTGVGMGRAAVAGVGRAGERGERGGGEVDGSRVAREVLARAEVERHVHGGDAEGRAEDAVALGREEARLDRA